MQEATLESCQQTSAQMCPSSLLRMARSSHTHLIKVVGGHPVDPFWAPGTVCGTLSLSGRIAASHGGSTGSSNPITQEVTLQQSGACIPLKSAMHTHSPRSPCALVRHSSFRWCDDIDLHVSVLTSPLSPVDRHRKPLITKATKKGDGVRASINCNG